MASPVTFTIGLDDSDRRLINRLCDALEANQASPESDSTACSGAGCPVPLNPDVQGTPDILAELRARAEDERDDAISFIHDMVRDKDLSRIVDVTAGEIVAYARVVRWLDELADANQQHSTKHEAE